MKALRWILALALALAAPFAPAQDRWPSKPIRIVVPLPPGAAGDLYARVYAQQLEKSLGVPVSVDNRPGASGIIGADVASKAPPDGYTLLWGFPQLFSMNPFLFTKLPYNADKDFVPIAHTYTGAFVLLATNSFPAKNVREMVAYAKAHPGKVDYGSYGPGGQPHLGMELISQAAGIHMVHIPYKGSPLQDLVAGHVQLMLEPSGSALPYIQSGKARALAVTSAKRLDVLPDVPTLSESLPGLEIIGNAGVWAPAGVPKDIADRLSREFVRITKLPEVQARLKEGGFQPTGLPADALAAVIRSETALWGGIIQAKNLHLD